MTDAVALLAISQIVCLGGLAYLYSQVQKLRHGGRQSRPRPGLPRPDGGARAGALPNSRAASEAYTRAPSADPAPRHEPRSAAALAAQLTDLGVDVPSLARRMNRSEEEVRLLLRRRGVAR